MAHHQTIACVGSYKNGGYAVRRITELECGRLMGFPEDRCAGLSNANPTNDEISWWHDVFETHRRLVTHTQNPKTEKQIRKWLENPYTRTAQYKMWGNSLVRQCAEFVLEGVVGVICG
jgi:DNA (cytosine-5)-methyltransferase 1